MNPEDSTVASLITRTSRDTTSQQEDQIEAGCRDIENRGDVELGVGRPFTRRHPRPTTNPTEPVTDATATPTRPGEQLA